jgi:uncharacterized protein YhaN
MKIDEIQVDGFGKFSDSIFGPFEKPLTVVYGPNEAGKSTLLSYLRQILFGFPSGRTTENRYDNGNGRQHGGSIFVTMDDGRQVNITRQKGRTAAGTLALHSDDGSPLDESELSNVIGDSIKPVFESIFAFDLSELSSFNSANNDEISSLLIGAGMSAPRLADTVKIIETAKKNIFLPSGKKQLVSDALSELGDLDSKLRNVQDQVSEYRSSVNELNETDVLLENVILEIERTQTQIRLLGNRIKARDAWIDLIGIREVKGESLTFEDFPKEPIYRLDILEAKLQEQNDAVENAAVRHQLAVDASKAVIQHELILEHSRAINRIREDRGMFQQAVIDLPDQRADLTSSETRLTDVLSTLGPSWTRQKVELFNATISLDDQIVQHRTSLENSDREQGELDFEVERINTDLIDTEQRTRDFTPESEDPIAQPKGISQLTLAAGAVVIGFLLGLTGLFIESPGLLGAGIGSGALGIMVIAYILIRRQSPPADVSVADRVRLDETRRSKARLQVQLNSLELQKESADSKQSALEIGLREWLESVGFPESLSPAGASEFVATIRTAKERSSDVDSQLGRVQDIENAIEKYSDLVTNICDLVEIVTDNNSVSILAASKEISEMYEVVRSAERERDESSAKASELESALTSITRRWQRTADELKNLLSEGGTENPEEFRRLAGQYSEGLELDAHERELITNLRHIVGPEYDLDLLDAELRNSSLEELETELEASEVRLKAHETTRTDLNRTHGVLTKSISTLISNEQASIWRADHASVTARLRSHAIDWVRFSLAEALLDATRRKYEQERQPGILERASGYFSQFTGGRYERIFSPLEGSEFQIVESGDSLNNKSPDQLSQGTLEQLYLAMRFAAVEEFGEKNERLPVVVDEVLVNFDPDRARKAAESFGEISGSNQVIVFTCHPWMRDLFQDAVPDSGLITLE